MAIISTNYAKKVFDFGVSIEQRAVSVSAHNILSIHPAFVREELYRLP